MQISKNFQKTDLVILAGGYGSRIKKYLKDNPKPLVKIKKIAFLDILINHYSKFPFEQIIILAGYRGNKIYKKYNNKMKNFVKIKVIVEKKPLGTGGSVGAISNILKNNILITNADSFLNVNLNEIFFIKNKNVMYLTDSHHYNSNKQLSNIKIDKNGDIKKTEKGKLMNAGIYLINKKNLNIFKKNFFSLENEIISKLIKQNKIKGKYVANFFIDMGTEKNLKKAKIILPNILKKPALFLDRDGVINHDFGYVHKVKDFKLRPGVKEGLRKILDNGYYLFIVTNQAGVAKKIYSKNDFFHLHKTLKKYLSSINLYFHDTEFCFFHPESKIREYKKQSNFRKPGDGMVKNILKNWFVDKNKSFFIGDKKSDKLCADKSKIRFFYAGKNFNDQINELI